MLPSESCPVGERTRAPRCVTTGTMVDGMRNWPAEVVRRSRPALEAAADSAKAPVMTAYMKDVAPFLGVQAVPRRKALRAAWADLPPPSSDELGLAARALMSEPERELHYGAYDLIDRFIDRADAAFCEEHVESLLTTTPWWDTVDGLVSAAVSPLCRRYGLHDLIDRWSRSGDRWLVRAALGHQRGWKVDTDVERVLNLCDQHWSDPEFFVAKAIGWALRDLSKIDAPAVEQFLADHPGRNAVAEREAHRGLGHQAGGRVSAAESKERSRVAAGSPAATFVGRQRLLAALEEDWKAVKSGASRITWLVGEAGIGKTALARHFTDGLDPALLSWVSADEAEQSLRFGVAEQILRSLGVEPTAPIPHSASDIDVGGELIVALGDAVSPRVLIIDDLQWADPPSMGALRFMLRRLEADGVLVVLVSQPAPWTTLGEPWRRFLEDARRVRHVAVEGLDADEVADLVEIVHGKRLDQTAAERLRSHAEGHPLRTSVLLRELTFDQVATPVGVLPAPHSFAELVLTRVEALDEATQSLVRAAAVLGSPFSPLSAGHLAKADDVSTALADAVEGGVLTDAGYGRVAFVHPLIRAAVYNAISPSDVRGLHSAAADITTGLTSLLHRVGAAEGADESLAAELAAAAERERACDNHTAASDLLFGAARLTSDPLDRDRYHLTAAEALLEGGDHPRAEVHRPILEACAPSALRDHVLGVLDTRGGRFDAALTRFDAALAAAPAGPIDGTGDVRARALAGMAWARWFSGDVSGALAAVEEALQGDVGWAGALCSYVRAMTLIELGRIDEVAKQSPPAGVSQVDALAVDGIVRYYDDDQAGSVTVLEEVVQRGRRGEPVQLLIPALSILAEAAFHLGRWDDASMYAELAVSLATDTDAYAALVQARAAATEIQAARGQFAEAAGHLEAAQSMMPLMPAWPVRPRVAVAAASLAIARDDADELQDAVRVLTTGWVGMQLDGPPWWRWRAMAAEALLAAGSLDDAASEIGRLAEVVAVNGYAGAVYDLARLQGLLAEAQGKPDVAQSAYEPAVATDPATQSPLSTARLAMARGRFLRTSGEVRRAIEELDGAHAILIGLGATPFAERCAAELAACGARAPDRVGRLAVDLSPRQEAVALLVADGHSNKEIASKLYISVKGVEYHLGQIFAKTGFRSRHELAAWIGGNESK